MNQKALLTATLLLLIGAVGVALLWRTLDEATPVRAADVATPGEALPAAAARSVSAAATDAATTAPESASGRALATNGTAAAQRPHREDAEWIVVRVVDKESGAPVGGAEVFWCDEPGHRELDRDITRTSAQRSIESRWAERAAESIGWSTIADAEGAARITHKGWTTVAARHDGKYGTLNIADSMLKPTNGFTIAIAADRSLRVRVVDDGNEPAANVALALGRFGEDDSLLFVWNWGISAMTGPDGIATLHHVQFAERMAEEEIPQSSELSKGQWRVFATLAGDLGPSAPVSLAAPPTEPVELKLPPCGSIRARVEIGGVPTRGVDEIALVKHIEGESSYGATPATAAPDAEGWAHFAHVPLHGRFSVFTQDGGGMSADCDGPTQPDQETTVVLGPTATAVLLRGRLLVAPNEPVRSQSIGVTVQGPKRQGYVDLRTDENGRFTASLGDAMDEDLVENLWFDLKREKGVPLRATITNRILRAGIDELGDLLMKDEPPFCSGRFVCGDQPFTKPIECWVWRHVTAENGTMDWRPVPGAVYHREDDGRFAFRGAAPPGRYRLVVDTSTVLPMEPIEFDAGVTDLVVQIDRGHPVAASVIVPDRAPMGSLGARLVPSPGMKLPDGVSERLWITAWSHVDSGSQWNLQWIALPAGSYALEIMVPTCSEPVARIADIGVPLPPNGDSRLEGIDLRQLVRVVKARLFDAAGQPLEAANGFVTPANGADRWSCTFWESEFSLVVPRAPTELFVVTDGHRPMRVYCDGERLDVKFEEWPTIEIEVTDMPQLPAGSEVVVALEPIDPVKTTYRAQWNDPAEFLPFATDSVSGRLQRNRTTLQIGEGKYAVSMRVEGPAFPLPLSGITPHEVLGNTRSLAVSAPRAEWERVIREVTSQLKAAGHPSNEEPR